MVNRNKGIPKGVKGHISANYSSGFVSNTDYDSRYSTKAPSFLLQKTDAVDNTDRADLKRQSLLNRQYNNTIDENQYNQQLGLAPIAPPQKSIEDEEKDDLYQKQILRKNLGTIVRPDVMNQLASAMSPADTVYVNNHFNQIVKDLKGRVGVTAGVFMNFLSEFKKKTNPNQVNELPRDEVVDDLDDMMDDDFPPPQGGNDAEPGDLPPGGGGAGPGDDDQGEGAGPGDDDDNDLPPGGGGEMPIQQASLDKLLALVERLDRRQSMHEQILKKIAFDTIRSTPDNRGGVEETKENGRQEPSPRGQKRLRKKMADENLPDKEPRLGEITTEPTEPSPRGQKRPNKEDDLPNKEPRVGATAAERDATNKAERQKAEKEIEKKERKKYLKQLHKNEEIRKLFREEVEKDKANWEIAESVKKAASYGAYERERQKAFEKVRLAEEELEKAEDTLRQSKTSDAIEEYKKAHELVTSSMAHARSIMKKGAEARQEARRSTPKPSAAKKAKKAAPPPKPKPTGSGGRTQRKEATDGFNWTTEKAFQELGIAPTTELKAIKKAFKKRALATHTDKGGKSEEFRKATSARDYLVRSLEQKKAEAVPLPEDGFGLKPKRKVTGRGLDDIDPLKGEFVTKGLKKLVHPRCTGVMTARAIRYSPFGEYKINMEDLRKNLLNIKFRSLGSIPKLPIQIIGNDARDFWIEVLESGRVSKSALEKLKKEDKQHFIRVVRMSRADDGLGLAKLNNEDHDEDMNRFEIVKGEILAGNDAPQLLSELKNWVRRFMWDGRINRRQAEELLSMISVV